ncbi:GNAT family N-acetyltransferase [Altererythrobacter sp. Root672]|uniref:GNAT family N-acetyltransferase n=1 Tax=Altererythrobacter sp. Root672 TaxID=1736584 RepID=UPI0006FC6679|nr:GNAT family N-acetyltransferase [Altererythrobacter sp. Root672]KRA80735.1 acetyltransferase [Altererythrobacter sp. Root672]
MAGGVQIRRATLADLDALAVLFDGYRQFYRQAPDLDGARTFLSDRLTKAESVVFLASDDVGAVGFTQLYPSFTSAGMARTFILNDLFVAPEARGQGAGSALLRHAAEFARNEGSVRLTLSTAVDNRTAQAVYEREGWQRDEAFLTYQLALLTK